MQAAQRGQRVAIARRRLGDLGPGRGGAVPVQPALGELGALAQDGEPPRGRHRLDQRVVHARAGLPLLGLAGHAPQLGPQLGVAGQLARGRGQRGERERRLPQLLLRDARGGAVRGGAAAGLRVRPGLGLQRPQPPARVRLAGQRARRHQRRARILRPELLLQRRERGRVVGRGPQRGGQPLHRGARVAHPGADARALQRGPGGLGRLRGGRRQVAERLGPPGLVAGGPERAGEPRQQARALLRGAAGQGGAARLGGGGGVAEPLLQHLGALREQRHLLGPGRRGGALRQQAVGVGPALGRERGAGEPGQHRRVAGPQLQRAPELRGRVVERAQVLLGGGGGADPERRLLLGPPGEPARRLDQQREQLAVRADLAGQRLAAGAGLGVVGAGPQRRGRGGERAAAVAQALGPDRGGVEQVAGALARIGGGGQLLRHPLQHGGLPGSVARGGVRARQRLRHAQRLRAARQQPLQERHRLRALRRGEPAGLDHGQRHPGGVGVAPERLGQRLGAGQLDHGALGGAPRARREPRQDRDPLLGRGRAALRLERRVQAPQRLVVLRALGEHRAPGGPGAVRLAGLGPEPRQLRAERAPLVAGRVLAPGLELAGQLLLLARPRQARLQRRARAAILRVHLDQRAPGPDGLLRLAQVAVQDLGHPAQQRLARLQVAVRGRRGGAVGARQLRERVGAGGGALHGLAGGRPGRVERERARQRAQRVARTPQALLLDLREPLEQAHPLAGGALAAGRQLQHARERLPLAGLGEERRQRGGGGGVAGVGAQRRLEVAPGAARVAELLACDGGGAHAQRRVGGLRRRGGEVALQHVQRLREAARVGLVLERLQRGGLAGGIELQRAAQRRQRGLGVAEAHQVHPRHLQVQGDLRGAVAGLRREARQRVGVAAVIAALGQHPLQQLQRGRRARRERPGPLDPLHRAAGALGIVGGVDLREPELERRGGAPVGRARRLRLEPAGLLAPGAREAAQPLPRGRRAGRGAIERERVDERVGRERVVERLVHQRGAQPRVLGGERARIGAGVARAVEQPLRLREAAERAEALHGAGARLLQRGIEPVRARVEQRGAIPPSEPLLLDLAQPERHRRGGGRVGRGGRLALQRGGHPRPVAALLEELHQRAKRHGVRRLELEQLPVQVLRAGHVAQLPVREGGSLGEQRARSGHVTRAPLVERDQLLPARAALVKSHERVKRLVVAGGRLERLDVGSDLLVQGGCAQGGFAGE
nr:hypothetical protein [Anaeromyxobacter sp. K]